MEKFSKALRLLVFGSVFLLTNKVASAQIDTTVTTNKDKQALFSPHKITYKSYLLPVVLIGYGTAATIMRVHRNDDKNVVLNTTKTEPSIFLQPENYTAFAPAAAVVALNLAGIRGKHTPAEQALLYGVSAGITAAIVYPLKSTTKVLRPDNTDFQSFPSSHAAMAFVSAEFLRREYGDQSAWYTVAGYAAATTTAIIRVAKDAHWVEDVCVGAGIGIASTTTTYWIYDKIKSHSKNKKSAGVFVLPAITPNSYGVYLTKAF